MKWNKALEFMFQLYVHYWYIPLLAFLLGVKICLVTMLVESVQHSERHRLGTALLDLKQKAAQVPRAAHLAAAAGSLLTASRLNAAAGRSGRNVRNSLTNALSRTTKSTTLSPEIIREWAILSNLENSHISPTHENRTDPESIWLIFNRIPRCAGRSIVQLLYTLAENNRFAHQEHEYRTPWPRFLIEQEQENLVTWFEYQHLPKSYDRHFFFVNFTRYQKFIKERPIYMNMVRDPVQRLRSFFQAKRANPDVVKAEISRRDEEVHGSGLAWYHRTFEECVLQEDPECAYHNGTQDFTLSVPFFCGQHPACVLINDKWAVQRAKYTIERFYSVVGVLERWNETLQVLEKYIPRFFTGVRKAYLDLEDEKKKKTDLLGDLEPSEKVNMINPISLPVRSLLEEKLEGEVDLYRFINQRLTAQISFISTRS